MDDADFLLKEVIPSTLKVNTRYSLYTLVYRNTDSQAGHGKKKIFHGKYFFAKKRDIKVLTAEILQ